MSEDPLAGLETALAEAIHRARNDLHAVIAMLRLQANTSTDPAARAALLTAEARVRALSNLNARLDAHAEGVEATIGSVAFLNGLTADLRNMHFGLRPATLNVSAEPHRIALVHAKPLGLILNELVVNALKYAFPDDRPGIVSINFRSQRSDYVLTVLDNGIGIDVTAPPQGTGLGRRMVRALTSQIGGTFEIRPGSSGIGTKCTIRWPTGSSGLAAPVAGPAPAA
jgi:two-component sensor histidine kinase